MKIGIATDHNGVNEKKIIIEDLEKKGYEVVDYSVDNYSTDDYPDFAYKLAKDINNEIDLGVLMCGTGIGMSIAANKVKGVRCAKISSIDEARLAKEHNNANVIAISYKENIDLIKYMVREFIESSFANEERHVRRINKIKEIEDNEL